MRTGRGQAGSTRALGVALATLMVLLAPTAGQAAEDGEGEQPDPAGSPVPRLPETVVPAWNECFQDVLLMGGGEMYGPTAVNAMTANQRMAVGLSREGTVTVLKHPRPSYYDQVKHRTNDRDAERFGALENEGILLGLLVPGEGTTWLRDLPSSQRYLHDGSDTVETRYDAKRLGVHVVVRDTVARSVDALVRDVTVEVEDPRRVPDGLEVVGFENLNVNVARMPYFPVLDWCTEELNADRATYDAAADAIVHTAAGVDLAAGEPRRQAMAVGLDRSSAQHQVGGDAHEGTALPAVGDGLPTVDAYEDAADGELTGNGDYAGQTTGAITAALDLRGGADRVRMLVAGGETRDEALAALDAARDLDAPHAAKRAWFDELLADAPLPDTDDREVLRLARRALVSLVSAYDERSGAVVASIATQSPYGADWPRDGAFFDVALGLIGREDWVATRNRWYAELQSQGVQRELPTALADALADAPEAALPDAQRALTVGDPGQALAALAGASLGGAVEAGTQSLVVPAGNWAMNYYADGVPAGPIPWEIDETGYAVWTMWQRAQATGDTETLGSVYPAIRRAADFLVDCADPAGSGLQCPAFEDDNFVPEQTIIGAGAVWLGLDAATQAAEALDEPADARRWGARRDELGEAIDAELASDGVYGRGNAAITWPACFHDYDLERYERHYEAMWSRVAPSFAEPEAGGERVRSLYESKALLALAKATRGDETWQRRVRRGLDWVATEHASADTGVMGEVWLYEDGDVVSAVSQPHLWEQVLFYLASLEAYPPASIDVDGVRDCAGAIGRLRAASAADPGDPEPGPPTEPAQPDGGRDGAAPTEPGSQAPGAPPEAPPSAEPGSSGPAETGRGPLPVTGGAGLLAAVASLALGRGLARPSGRQARPTGSTV